MTIGIKRTQRDYTQAFKLSVVEQVEHVELTCKEVQKRYGIQGRFELGLVLWKGKLMLLYPLVRRFH